MPATRSRHYPGWRRRVHREASISLVLVRPHSPLPWAVLLSERKNCHLTLCLACHQFRDERSAQRPSNPLAAMGENLQPIVPSARTTTHHVSALPRKASAFADQMVQKHQVENGSVLGPRNILPREINRGGWSSLLLRQSPPRSASRRIAKISPSFDVVRLRAAEGRPGSRR